MLGVRDPARTRADQRSARAARAAPRRAPASRCGAGPPSLCRAGRAPESHVPRRAFRSRDPAQIILTQACRAVGVPARVVGTRVAAPTDDADAARPAPPTRARRCARRRKRIRCTIHTRATGSGSTTTMASRARVTPATRPPGVAPVRITGSRRGSSTTRAPTARRRRPRRTASPRPTRTRRPTTALVGGRATSPRLGLGPDRRSRAGAARRGVVRGRAGARARRRARARSVRSRAARARRAARRGRFADELRALVGAARPHGRGARSHGVVHRAAPRAARVLARRGRRD